MVGSTSIGIVPSTRMSSEDTKVEGGLFEKLEGSRVLEPACEPPSEENRGDFPLREGVPRGEVAGGLPCIF